MGDIILAFSFGVILTLLTVFYAVLYFTAPHMHKDTPND